MEPAGTRGTRRLGIGTVVSGVLLLVLLAAGMAADLLQAAAPVALLALWGAAVAWRGVEGPWLRGLAWLVVVALGLALALHRVPGFANPVWVEAIGPGLQGATVPLRLNLDKGLAGLILYLVLARHAGGERGGRVAIGQGLLIGMASAAVVLPLAYALLGVAPDPKLPAWAGPWLAGQLLLTALPEEAFFRALFHEPLRQAWVGWRFGISGPILVTALLFGLAHAGGGPAMVVLAALAGIGYGWAYVRGGGVEAAILAHVTLNAVHAFGFSYPVVAVVAAVAGASH